MVEKINYRTSAESVWWRRSVQNLIKGNHIKFIEGVFCFFSFFFTGFYSTMISHVTSYQTTLMAWLSAVGFGERYWAPCYKGSVDGWHSKTFHSKCDSKGPSLTLARKGSYLFGGFADRSWKGEFLSSWQPLLPKICKWIRQSANVFYSHQ